MGETANEILRTQQTMNWALIIMTTELLLAIVVAAWGLWVSRGTKQSMERVEQSFERMSFYLFRKLGPIELPPPEKL